MEACESVLSVVHKYRVVRKVADQVVLFALFYMFLSYGMAGQNGS